jgi:hypothetical protein
VARVARATEQDQQVTFSQVRRQGLEPRTRGLRVGCWAAADALPAPTAHLTAPQAANTQAFGRYSFHDPFHGPMAGTAGTCHGQSRSAACKSAGIGKYRGATSTAVREAIRRSGAAAAHHVAGQFGTGDRPEAGSYRWSCRQRWIGAAAASAAAASPAGSTRKRRWRGQRSRSPIHLNLTAPPGSFARGPGASPCAVLSRICAGHPGQPGRLRAASTGLPVRP